MIGDFVTNRGRASWDQHGLIATQNCGIDLAPSFHRKSRS